MQEEEMNAQADYTLPQWSNAPASCAISYS